jgi:hypothetical protein
MPVLSEPTMGMSIRRQAAPGRIHARAQILGQQDEGHHHRADHRADVSTARGWLT